MSETGSGEFPSPAAPVETSKQPQPEANWRSKARERVVGLFRRGQEKQDITNGLGTGPSKVGEVNLETPINIPTPEPLKPHAQPERIQLTNEQQRLLNNLRSKYPDNPLFDNDFRGVPENYRSVYTSMSEARLQASATGGLKPSTEFLMRERIDRIELDKVFDNVAPDGYSRTNSVYAFPDLKTALDWTKNGGMLQPGDILVEIKVDPKKVLVTDQDVVSEVDHRNALAQSPKHPIAFDPSEREDIAKVYWEKAMTLEEYRQLPEDESWRYTLPEVVIPGVVKPEFMRVASIIAPQTEK